MLEFQWLWGFLWGDFWGCIEVGGSGLEVAQRVGVVGFWVVGRGCLAYPNFFLEIPSNFGNYPHFSA